MLLIRFLVALENFRVVNLINHFAAQIIPYWNIKIMRFYCFSFIFCILGEFFGCTTSSSQWNIEENPQQCSCRMAFCIPDLLHGEFNSTNRMLGGSSQSKSWQQFLFKHDNHNLLLLSKDVWRLDKLTLYLVDVGWHETCCHPSHQGLHLTRPIFTLIMYFLMSDVCIKGILDRIYFSFYGTQLHN